MPGDCALVTVSTYNHGATTKRYRARNRFNDHSLPCTYRRPGSHGSAMIIHNQCTSSPPVCKTFWNAESAGLELVRI